LGAACLVALIRIQTRIARLKRRARRHHEAYHDLVDRMNCGRWLAEQVSAEVAAHKVNFNKAMDELARLDPANCPEFRL
jgi:alkylation response protein AidB-like acyl-CoA dehydrogenase